MALTKVSGGILDPGINVAGIVTATGFDGPFTGGSSSNINAGIITATGFDLNGNGDISGNLVIDGNLTANGDFTTLNTTLREVEILRVDANTTAVAGIITQTGAGDLLRLYDGTSQVVTVDDEGNVGLGSAIPSEKLDVVGVTSFTGDVFFKGGLTTPAPRDMFWDYSAAELRCNDNAAIFLGSNKDAFLAHDGSSTRLQDNYGHFFIGGNLIQIKSGNLSKEFIRMNNADNTVKLYFNTTEQLSTVGYGITVFGTTETQKLNVTGISTFVGTATGTIFKVPDATNVNGATNHIAIGDNSDLKLYHDNSGDAYITNDTGHLTIRNDTSGKIINLQPKSGANGIIARYEGAAELYHNGNLKFATGNTVNTNSNHFEITSGQQLRFDNSNNNRTSEILNDGSSGNSVITFKTNGGNRWTIDSSGHIVPGTAGAVDIGSTGAEIGDVYIADSKKIHLGSDQDFTLYHNDAHAIIKNTTGRLYVLSDDLWFKNQADNSNLARFLNGDTSLFYYAGDEKLRTHTTGILVTGEVAASQDYPNFRPTLDLNFAAEKKLDPRITYTRTGPASFVNEFGKVVLVGDNAPRFDHDPTTRECKGLLIEESKLNYIDNSNDLSQWNRNINSSVNVANTTETLSPEGINNSTKMTGGSNSGMSRDNIITLSATTSYTASIFAKKGTTNTFRLELGSGANNIVTFFNLDTKAFSSSEANGYFASYSTSYVDYPNGWVRIILSGTTGGSVAGTVNFAVYGLSGGYAYFWGAQAEVGAFPTSLIPTNGSTATRGADIALIDGEEFSEFYNPIESTILVDYTHDITSSQLGTDQRVYRFRAVGGSDTRIDYVSNSGYNPYIAKDGSAVASISHGQSTVFGGGVNRSAVRVKENSFAVSFNGSTAVEDTSGAWNPTNAITEVTLGSSNGGSSLNGHMQRFMYYSTGLPNSQLKTLTS